MEANETAAVLCELFDHVFEIDLKQRSVSCLRSDNDPFDSYPINVRMLLGDTLEYWLEHNVYPDDRDKMRSFFVNSFDGTPGLRHLQTEFRLQGENAGKTRYCGHLIGSGDIYRFCFDLASGKTDTKAASAENGITEKRNGDEEAVRTDEGHRVTIRAFGYFDVFSDGSPVLFRNKKAKELLALLVDRNGGFVTSHEAVSYLWENEPVNTLTLSRLRKVAMELRNVLASRGIGDIIESADGRRRIIPEKVSCDYFDFLSGDEKYASLFKGVYMMNYSWGEITLAGLL